MLDSSPFKKAICIVTIFSFTLASTPRNAGAAMLVPLSFSDMYTLAQSGEVESLRASVHRGMNIDVMDSNGNTGMCLAARNRDAYTYNAFRAAGANPHHPCFQNVNGYEDFVRNSRAVPVTSSARDAYGTIGKEEFSVSPRIWWVVGGLAVAGGATAIALAASHSGGGSKKGHSHKPSSDYKSLSSTVAQNGKILKNTDQRTSNNSNISINNENTVAVESINLRSNVLKNTDFINVALKAEDGGTFTNNSGIILNQKSGTAGIVSFNGSQGNNNGYININAYNAAVGMIAGKNSTAINNGSGIISNNSSGTNGIDMKFSGYDKNNTIVGMYADTNSTIYNNGDIKGAAIKSAQISTETVQTDDNEIGLTTDNPEDIGQTTVMTASDNGTIIGMEAMILNQGKNLNKNTIKVQNNSAGKINLSAGDGGSETQVKVNMIGMASYLDYLFTDGSYDISRAENVTLTNSGNITLGYTGEYTMADASNLRKGNGGVIGMRADANTKAYNDGSILLTLNESSSSSNIDLAAGMQSVHGADLYNDGQINITTSSGNQHVNYGLLSVEGSGSVSGLYTNLKQKLTNSGTINIQASNSFGIASYNGGDLQNLNRIVLGKPGTTTQYQKNIAMYAYGKTTEAAMKNTGTIDIYSHDSIAMQNDFAGGTEIINDGTINVYESATDSYIFGGAYSEAHNANTIYYEATSNQQTDPAKDGVKYNPMANYNLSVGISVISTKSRSVIQNEQSSSSSSSTEKIYNDEDAIITMNGSSFVAAMSVETNDGQSTSQARAYNNGLIKIYDRTTENGTNAVGMYIDSGSINNAGIINNGRIITSSRFSAAMASISTANADVINGQNNDDALIETNKEYSLGIYSSGYSNIRNMAAIRINGDNSVGIHSAGSSGKSHIYNTGSITVGSNQNPAENSYGIYLASGTSAAVENFNTIDVYTKTAGSGIYSSGSDVTMDNRGNINIFGDEAYGIYAAGNATITNHENAFINVGTAAKPVSDSYGLYLTNSGDVINRGTINLYNKGEAYAVYVDGSANVVNDGTVNLYADNATAFYARQGKVTNKNTLNLNFNGSNALAAAQNGVVINDSNGIINVGSSDKSVSNSNGFIYKEGNTTAQALINNGTINLYNSGGSHAISVLGTAAALNSGFIYSDSNDTAAVYNNSEAAIVNSGTIKVNGSDVYAIRSVYFDDLNEYNSTSSGLTIENKEGGIISVGEKFKSARGYGIAAKTISSIINSGTIRVANDSGYGIYAENGDLIKNSNTGIITVSGVSGVGIYGGSVDNIINDGEINVKGSGSGIGGGNSVTNNGSIYVANGNGIINATDITNTGSIIVSGGSGIKTDKPGTILNSGSISVHGGGHGIDVTVPNSSYNVTITNTGTIAVDSGSYGIFVNKKFSDEEGKVSVSPGDTSYIILCNGAACSEPSTTSSIASTSSVNVLNLGTIAVNDDVDFGEQTLSANFVSLGKAGTFQAKSFSGTVIADNSLVQDGFETEYVNEDSFIGEDNGLNILSASYMFDATLQSNQLGNINVVLVMNSFEDMVSNSKLSAFLNRNYQLQRGEDIFNTLKSAGTKKQFDNYLNRELGFSFIPNLAKQSLDAEKTIGANINDNLLQKTATSVRQHTNVIAYANEVKNKQEVSGYKDKVIAIYGFSDKAIGNSLRLGFGLYASRLQSDFDDESYRYNNVLEVYSPLIWQQNNYSALFKPKLGFGQGHYRRKAVERTYKADTKEIYYGFDSEIRHGIDLGYFNFAPNAGFDVTGLYTKYDHESRGGLRLKDKNNISAVLKIGAAADKTFHLKEDEALRFGAQVEYFHECGDKYNNRTKIDDMAGYYDIADKRFQRNYGLLGVKTGYDYKHFSLDFSLNKPLQPQHNFYYLFNLGYDF